MTAGTVLVNHSGKFMVETRLTTPNPHETGTATLDQAISELRATIATLQINEEVAVILIQELIGRLTSLSQPKTSESLPINSSETQPKAERAEQEHNLPQAQDWLAENIIQLSTDTNGHPTPHFLLSPLLNLGELRHFQDSQKSLSDMLRLLSNARTLVTESWTAGKLSPYQIPNIVFCTESDNSWQLATYWQTVDVKRPTPAQHAQDFFLTNAWKTGFYSGDFDRSNVIHTIVRRKKTEYIDSGVQMGGTRDLIFYLLEEGKKDDVLADFTMPDNYRVTQGEAFPWRLKMVAQGNIILLGLAVCEQEVYGHRNARQEYVLSLRKNKDSLEFAKAISTLLENKRDKQAFVRKLLYLVLSTLYYQSPLETPYLPPQIGNNFFHLDSYDNTRYMSGPASTDSFWRKHEDPQFGSAQGGLAVLRKNPWGFCIAPYIDDTLQNVFGLEQAPILFDKLEKYLKVADKFVSSNPEDRHL